MEKINYKLADKIKKHIKNSEHPLIIVISGVNGAGKTTLAFHLSNILDIRQRVSLGSIVKTLIVMNPKNKIIIDIGTGSGNIIVALAKNLKEKNNLLSKIYGHEGLDVEEIVKTYIEFDKRIDKYIKDVPSYLNNAISEGKSILLEGAQGALLDVDHGTYPYVTSSSPTSGGACTGTGIPPNKITEIVGIVKAYTTRVGMGPFPTELNDSDGKKLQDIGAEFGATTGRPRRCGWYDAPLVKYSAMINGLNYVAVTKLDVLDHFDKIKVCVNYELDGKILKSFPTDVERLSCVKPVYETLTGWNSDISACTSYNELPQKTKEYLDFISQTSGIKIRIVSVGPKREQTFNKE